MSCHLISYLQSISPFHFAAEVYGCPQVSLGGRSKGRQYGKDCCGDLFGVGTKETLDGAR